jgi:hypothetical protein
MSAKKGKSVMGGGDEFSWVSPATEEPAEPKGVKSTKGQVAESTSRQKPKSSSRQVAKSTRVKTVKPQEKTEDQPLQKLGIYLRASTVFALKTQALKEGRSASAIVQDLVSEYCD